MATVTPTARTALVLTALPEEMAAVLPYLDGDPSPQMAGPILCEIGYFTTSDGSRWRVAAAEIGTGTVKTAGAVAAVAGDLQPDVVMFVGIAGALKSHVHVGDVVVATEVAWTERGKWSQDGYLPRVLTGSLSEPLVQVARKVARDGHWRDRLAVAHPDARAIVGQIASGEKVVADADYRAWLLANFSDALAIDNEGFALAWAAETYANGRRIVVRGISDNADGDKSDDGHADAAASAAAFAFELIDAYSLMLRPPDDADRGPGPPEDADRGPGGTPFTDRDPPGAAGARREDDRRGHVFISYAHMDAPDVDRLVERLKSADVRVWRDTADLWPGEDWRVAIRQAITDEALVFLACFSRRSLARDKSYQNEELILAVEHMRMRQWNVPWLIPVRLDDCAIPDVDLGAGRTLRSIQHADLFGQDHERNLVRLIAAIRRMVGGDEPIGAPSIAEVAFFADADGYRLAIDGSGFGTPVRATPHHGTLPNFRIAISAQIGRGEWGYSRNANLLRYESWNDNRIVVSGLRARPGDAMVLALWNDQTKAGVCWGGNLPPAPAAAPAIEDVVFSGPAANPVVMIRGRGFGPAPVAMPCTASIEHLAIGDWRRHPEGMGPSGTWTGGVIPRVASWSDDAILISGFAGTFGRSQDVIRPGDPLSVQVWNTSGDYPSGPQTAWGGRFPG